jgi:hypothetical protein
MTNLLTTKQGFLVPQNSITDRPVYMLTPNEINYVGMAILTLTDEALCVSTPGCFYDVTPLQNIHELPEVKEFRGFSYVVEMYGQYKTICPRETWGLAVKYHGGNFIYQLSFVTFAYQSAVDWQGMIQNAIARQEQQVFDYRPQYRFGG